MFKVHYMETRTYYGDFFTVYTCSEECGERYVRADGGVLESMTEIDGTEDAVVCAQCQCDLGIGTSEG